MSQHSSPEDRHRGPLHPERGRPRQREAREAPPEAQGRPRQGLNVPRRHRGRVLSSPMTSPAARWAAFVAGALALARRDGPRRAPRPGATGHRAITASPVEHEGAASYHRGGALDQLIPTNQGFPNARPRSWSRISTTVTPEPSTPCDEKPAPPRRGRGRRHQHRLDVQHAPERRDSRDGRRRHLYLQ